MEEILAIAIPLIEKLVQIIQDARSGADHATVLASLQETLAAVHATAESLRGRLAAGDAAADLEVTKP